MADAKKIVHNVLVIGAGVSGLTTALALARRDRGNDPKFNVQVFAENYHDEFDLTKGPNDPANVNKTRLVSTVAGALWEFPPAVCGMHGNQLSIARSEKWCMIAYYEFKKLAELALNTPSEKTGVRMRDAYFYFGENIDDDRVERVKRDKLKKLADKDDKENGGAHVQVTDENGKQVPKVIYIDTFEEFASQNGELHDEVQKADKALGGNGKGERVRAGYKLAAPVIETPVYMDWLLKQVENQPNVAIIRSGGRIPKPGHFNAPLRITDRLAPQEDELRELFGVDAIVNCSALGAAELAGDSMIPLRGALVAVPRKMFKDQQGPEHAFAMAKSKFQQDMIFVVPREKEVMIGGFAEPSQYRTDLTKDYPEVKKMFEERSIRFLKGMDHPLAELVGNPVEKPVSLDNSELRLDVGLRPYRAQNVFVEREYGNNIVHNYGHSGSGFSFSYGTAEEVVDLVESMEGTAFHTKY